MARNTVGWGLETIFRKDSNLYIGSMQGMYIYSIAEPMNPSFISQFSHMTSCDPVVVEGDYAYVTLRSGSGCRMGSNQLDIIDLSDLSAPKLLKTYAMINPHGLAIVDSSLFICEGENGLKIFDAADPQKLELLSFMDEIEAIDIIVEDGLASMIGYTKVYQYRLTNPREPELISTIKIVVLLTKIQRH